MGLSHSNTVFNYIFAQHFVSILVDLLILIYKIILALGARNSRYAYGRQRALNRGSYGKYQYD